jgi:hypothetical protein
MKLFQEGSILLENYESLKDWPVSTSHPFNLSILLVSNTALHLRDIYQYLAASSQSIQVSLAFNLSLQEVQAIAPDDIVSFFFLPNYRFAAGQPVMEILCQERGEESKVKEVLQKICLSQKFTGGLFKEIGPGNVVSANLFATESSPSFIKFLGQAFEKMCKGETTESLSVSVQTALEIPAVLDQLTKCESGLEREHPGLYSLLVAIKELRNHVAILETKVRYQATQLENERSYNALLREDHQAKLIQDFYDQEYEVLPTWYKRFGHVVKILTGKRRLRF